TALPCFGGCLLPFLGRGLCAAVEIERKLDPTVEIGLGAKSFSIDMDIAAVFPTLHDDGGAALPFKRRVMDGRGDAAHNTPFADGDAHLALDHESKAAEHAFFRNAAARS